MKYPSGDAVYATTTSDRIPANFQAEREVDGLEFWTVRPDTLDVHRLQVKREGEEALELNGERVSCVKLKIQLTGMKSIFWRSYYWLRVSDGLFVRYEGPSGPPGWPMTTVEILDYTQRIKTGSKRLF